MTTPLSQADALDALEAGLAIRPAEIPGGVKVPPGLPPQGCSAAELVRALLAAPIVHDLNGQGPDLFNCYAFAQLIQFWLFGRRTLEARLVEGADSTAVLDAISTHAARRAWRPVKSRPLHGDLVSMSHVHEPFHIGVWLDLDRGVILHCAPFTGVTVDDRPALLASGWNNLRFYRWAGDQ